MLPIYLAGLAVGALAVKAGQQQLNKLSGVSVGPGDERYLSVLPKDGSVVCCGIYQGLTHTGIWTDDGIVELAGSGLVRLVSSARFTQGRSGETIYVLADQNRAVWHSQEFAERALKQVFTYREYALLANNCHRFVAECLSLKQASSVVLFSDLNFLLNEQHRFSLGYYPICRYNVN